jgi:hypothetical protein
MPDGGEPTYIQDYILKKFYGSHILNFSKYITLTPQPF